MRDNVRHAVYHIPSRAAETRSIMMQRNDVFWDLNITFKYFVCLKKKSVNSNVLSLNLKLFRTEVDIKGLSEITHLEITLSTHFYRIREEGGSGRTPHRSYENR